MAQRDYDYIALFNPEGKVEPLSNIEKSIQLGALSVSLVNNNTCEGVILAHKLINQDIPTTKVDDKETCGNDTELPPSISLEYPQKKVFKVSDKTLYTFAGITNDGLEIFEYILNKSINERVNKDRNIDGIKVFDRLAQVAGQRIMYNQNRPFGCGCILLNIVDKKIQYQQKVNDSISVHGGVEFNKGHGSKEIQLVEFGAGGKVSVCKATSIGNRAQSARTILERDYNENLTFDEMVRIGIKAMKNAISSLQNNQIDIWGINDAGVFEELEIPTEAEAYAQIIGLRKTLELISLERRRCIEEDCKEEEVERSVNTTCLMEESKSTLHIL